MKKNINRKLMIFTAIVILSLFTAIVTKNVSAATECFMQDGVIKIEITSKAATTNIRYRTIGFTLTTNKSPLNATAKGITGPDAPIGPSTKIYLSNGMKSDGGVVNGMTKTTFTFTEQQVKLALKDIFNLDNISTNTKIYFNAIFQTYEVSGDREIIHPGEITTWRDIVNAQEWGSISNFDDYFNIGVDFKPGLQPSSLYFDFDSKSELQNELPSLNINEYLKWNTRVLENYVNNGKTYKLKGYYINNKLNGQTIISKYIDKDGITASSIINGSAKVPYGGLNVHMVYEMDYSSIPYKNTLYYRYNNINYKAADLAEKLPGSKVTWSTQARMNAPETIIGSGRYQLQGYYIEAKDRSVSLQGRTSLYKSIDNVDDEAIYSSNAIVVKGGLNIIFVYDNTIPTPTPTPKPSVTPVPSIPPLEIPNGGNESKPVPQAISTGIIKADIRGSERFIVEAGIPTTESLYTQVETTEYLLGYDFEKVVVIKEYPVVAKKTYNLSWKSASDPTKTVTEKVTIAQNLTIKRACAYWKINSISYFVLDNAVIYNKALPDGKSIMYPDTRYYNPPALNTYVNGSESYHIIAPEETKGDIILSETTLTSTDSNRPIINPESFLPEADSKVGQIKVRNDFISFNGVTVLSSDIVEKEAPAIANLSVLNVPANNTNTNVLYKPDQIIEATLENNTYNSSGTMTYRLHSSSVTSSATTRSNVIYNINQVKVHTPVICDASITANNKKWVQLIDPKDDYVPLVLDPDPTLSDFTVQISNTGKHSSRTGYYTRNMAWSLRSPSDVSYLAQKNMLYRNEVQFPFDVFRDHASGEDEYIPKNTWITIAFNTPSFYLPMWVEEGDYTVSFRTIAVNAITNNKINLQTEKYANTDPNNYVATDTVHVQVSGRIYGLTITDISDEKEWGDVFHYKGMTALKIDGTYESGVNKTKFDSSYAYDYTVGTRDQYGNETDRLPRFTLPLVNGSHPKWTNVGIMKKGYTVNYKLTTTGSMYESGDSILIRPKFYHVDSKGENRQEVDIYYSQYFNGKSNHLVKIGSAMDKTNINTFRVDQLLPEKKWKTMADILNISYLNYKVKKLDLFTYNKIQIYFPLMAYTNLEYLTSIKNNSEYSDIRDAGIKPADIMKREQTWYGKYWLPADIHAVAKGYDVFGYSARKGIKYNESFWLDDGYIIINFEIVTVDSSGKERLSYTNTNNALNGYCSMWNMENAATYKTSYNGKAKKSITFNFEPGDFQIYFADISLRDDYSTYIIN